jgi:hypothetical protein
MQASTRKGIMPQEKIQEKDKFWNKANNFLKSLDTERLFCYIISTNDQ